MSIRPETVTVQLLADGSPVIGKTATVGEAEGWTWKFKDLPMYGSGKQIVYSVVEVNVPDGYSAVYNGMNVQDPVGAGLVFDEAAARHGNGFPL